MRQILLDTETTGFDPKTGDRIIEIGAVELVKRRLTGAHYHQYIQPERDVPEDAIRVHGITNEFLVDKPVFVEIVNEFMEFVQGAELIIHNAPFDVAFINHELSLLESNSWGKIEDHCQITDSLVLARKQYPGQRNSLDALCKRLGIDNSNRTLHGALLDSEILADVYLAMTGGQKNLLFANADPNHEQTTDPTHPTRGFQRTGTSHLKVIRASSNELKAHQAKLEQISKKIGMDLNW